MESFQLILDIELVSFNLCRVKALGHRSPKHRPLPDGPVLKNCSLIR